MSKEQQLIDSYLDGELTADEEGRLTEWLAAEPEHVHQFVRETHLHRQIREGMLACPYRAYGLSEVASAERKVGQAPMRWLPRQLSQWLGLPWSPTLRWLLAPAVCLALVAGLSFWYFGPTMGKPVLVEVQ